MANLNNFSGKFRKEIKESIVEIGTGQVIKSKEKTTYFPAKFDPDQGYLFWTRTQGARIFANIPYPDGMSKADIGNLAILSKHILGKTNLLGRRKRGEVKPYSARDIGILLDLNEDQAERFLKRAHRYGVIKPVSVPFGERVEIQYYMNPLYYLAGNRLSPNLYLLFREEIDAYLPTWVKEQFAEVIAGRDMKEKESTASGVATGGCTSHE